MRLFEIYDVTKPGQQNESTSKLPGMLFSGTPSAAAKKAMSALCKSKNISGVCTLTVTMREVKRSMVKGTYVNVPVVDSDNMQIMRKYKMKRVNNETPVTFEGTTPITFKYKIEIIESFGRVA